MLGVVGSSAWWGGMRCDTSIVYHLCLLGGGIPVVDLVRDWYCSGLVYPGVYFYIASL